MRRFAALSILLFLGLDWEVRAYGQQTGTLQGVVTTEAQKLALHNATVLIVQLGRSAETDEEGKYEIRGIPPGSYDVVAHLHALTDQRRTVQIAAGATVVVDFQLSLSHLRESITVTASGREQTTFESFQSVTAVDSLQLASKNSVALGEVLEGQPGVAKRSFGPGSSRPVLRGFDGDRVLVLNDGLATGTLSSQSGEHAEPIDATSLDRLEIVKGPATLLYGSNAIGGVVNTISEHHSVHEHPHQGVRGHITTGANSINAQGTASTGFEYGREKWMVWGSIGRQDAADYSSPLGRVENSDARQSSASSGFGWFGHRPFFSLTYSAHDGRIGVPFAGEFHSHEGEGEEDGAGHDHAGEAAARVSETYTLQNTRLNTGARELGSFVERFRVTASFSRWIHREMENSDVATIFDNKALNYRVMFDQKKAGPLQGSFGFQGMYRDYLSSGEEALSPPVRQDNFALFTLQEIGIERVKFQLGGRLEHNRYVPVGLERRSFTGFSGAAGIRVPLWKGGALVTNYTHSYRSPALEELYNFGPHVGNLAFEIGDPNLRREKADGVDLSVRHANERVRGQFDVFYYRLGDFVFPALSGEIEHSLPVVLFQQGNARFVGGEALLDVRLHPKVWLNLAADAVNSKLTETNTPLPRIPPLRGRVGLDVQHKGFRVRPEVIMVHSQDDVYPAETPTAGYALVQLDASYVLADAHTAHVFSVTGFNLGNRLYRNHLSFIKDLAPEVGRGVRFTYSLRFF
jgi:iron complex outermembrane receptor protein